MITPAPILSERLELIPLAPAIIRAILSGDEVRVGQSLRTTGPADWPGDLQFLELRLGQMEADPRVRPFLVRAMVHRENRTLIGHIGFHTGPNPPYLLELGLRGLELGYTVFERHRSQGYATEATEAMMNWAYAEHGVDEFVLSIAPDNEPSLRIARRFGFSFRKVFADPADGIEHVFAGRYPVR